MIKPDPLGILDILSATLVLFTSSFLPETFLHYHAGFLYLKGGLTMIKPEIIPLPIFYIGNMADIISAAIIFTGEPIYLADYQNWIASLLFLKGAWGMTSMLKLVG